ncbi:hypothetical protein [Marinobacterium litorale]|uniref:hypothetical protein n=1 Tax=Marinobacterium litorale TaxID=404770 RepID=UPI00040E40E3|nr:hypothetical protein [Marinobacterium litorale]
MTTIVEKCPACSGDAVDRSGHWQSVAPNGDELNRKIYAIEKAVTKYYLALDNREHGGVAENKAFNEIQEILGMSWKRGETAAFLEAHPKLKPLYA